MAELKANGAKPREIEYLRFRRIETLLNARHGSCALAREAVAQMTIQELGNLEEQGHEILRWTIMPNHINFLIRVRDGISLASVIRFFKARTGREANKIIGQAGRFWFPEFFDRYIRDREHLDRVIRYIDQNPVKAGLVKVATDWPFGSVSW